MAQYILGKEIVLRNFFNGNIEVRNKYKMKANNVQLYYVKRI